MKGFALGSSQLQAGLVGYEQRQVTAKSGPQIIPEESIERYAVNAIGLASNLVFPKHKLNFGVKWFDEFANRATFQGYSLQFSGAVSF